VSDADAAGPEPGDGSGEPGGAGAAGPEPGDGSGGPGGARAAATAQARADALLEAYVGGLPPAEAAQALAVLSNRAVARLYALARAQAAASREAPAWPVWAQLQNAARAQVLQASTCRDLALRLPRDAA
jgi:hypothetical protein